MPDSHDQFRGALAGLLHEILDGPRDAAFFLNPGDRGLLKSLDALSASAASAHGEGRPSIAAHADHLRYGLHLLNRWARGEDPFHDARFAESWKRQTVSEEDWRKLRAALSAEANAWVAAVAARSDWNQASMTEAMGSVIHLAYHLGAIRQLSREVIGPRAKD
jgi:hypothetical protein